MPSIEQLERLLAATPEDPFILYALAQEHARLGHHDRAVEFYDRCIAADPAYCYAYFHKARSLQALDRDAQAALSLQSGISAAEKIGDRKALSELSAYLDEISP
jgi:tetratricopeptide (TPR) repeat protein